MALTRTALKERGVDKETIDFIMEAHGETVEAAKEKAKETAETTMQKIIDTLQAKVDSLPAADGEDWKAKYEAEVIAHTATKTTHDTEKTTTAKRSAARQALKALGAHDEDLDTFLLDKVDYDKVVLDGDKVKDPKAFESYKEQYRRYFGETVTVGAGVATPPKGDPPTSYTMEQIKSMTPAQINANWDKGVKQALEGGK